MHSSRHTNDEILGTANIYRKAIFQNDLRNEKVGTRSGRFKRTTHLLNNLEINEGKTYKLIDCKPTIFQYNQGG